MANEEKNITDTIGNINTAIDGALKEGLNKLDDISNVGKSVLGTPAKIVDGMLLTDKVAKATTEKGKFTEVYKWGVSLPTTAGGTWIGAKAGVIGGAWVGSLFPIVGTAIGATIGAIGGAALGALGGNKGGESLAESTTNEAYSLYQTTKDFFTDSNPQQSYTPLSPQGISFPYSSIIYLTTIKALKDTLKEYLPKAKKIVLYTPNPFVSLYTSSPSYVFNSNLSFFNPHLQYLLTSKDTQQWLYDTLFNLARDNREIIVYEWGGSIEELDSKDTNQSTNIQKQTKTYYLSPQGQRLKEKQPYCIKVIAKESKVFTILRDFITSFNTTKEQEVFRALEILLKDKESLEHLRQCIIKSLKEPIIESIYSLKETKDLNKEELKENVEEVFNNLLGVA